MGLFDLFCKNVEFVHDAKFEHGQFTQLIVDKFLLDIPVLDHKGDI